MPIKKDIPYSNAKKVAAPKTNEKGNKYTNEFTPSNPLNATNPNNGKIKSKIKQKCGIS